MVVLGKIIAPYGIRGAVKVFPFADDPLAWSKLPQWWLGREKITPEESPKDDAPERWQAMTLRRCRPHKALLIAEFDGLQDRDAAEALKGALVGVPREALPPTGDGEYYWGDLIGLEVINTQAHALGRVLGLIETPGNAVLRIGDGEGKERLLPFIGTVVLDVDVSARRLRVDWEADW